MLIQSYAEEEHQIQLQQRWEDEAHCQRRKENAVSTNNDPSSYINDLMSNLICAASNDDDEDYDIAAQEEPNEPARDGEAQHPHHVTLYFGSWVSILLSDLFDFTSQGRNNNGFEHFQQAGKSNLAKEMEIYETVGTQMWQEEINKLGSENSPIEVM